MALASATVADVAEESCLAPPPPPSEAEFRAVAVLDQVHTSTNSAPPARGDLMIDVGLPNGQVEELMIESGPNEIGLQAVTDFSQVSCVLVRVLPFVVSFEVLVFFLSRISDRYVNN